MATKTLTVGQVFPDGTTVSAYPVSNWRTQQELSGAPVGSTAGSAGAVSGSVVTVTGLADDTQYVLVGDIGGGTYRYLRFDTASIASTASGVSDASAGQFRADGFMLYNGASWDRARTPTTFTDRTDASITAGTAQALWTPTSGKKFRLMSGQLSAAVAGQIILKDATTEILRSPKLAAAGVWVFDLGNGRLSAAANNVLNVDVSATGNVGGYVAGTEE